MRKRRGKENEEEEEKGEGGGQERGGGGPEKEEKKKEEEHLLHEVCAYICIHAHARTQSAIQNPVISISHLVYSNYLRESAIKGAWSVDPNLKRLTKG